MSVKKSTKAEQLLSDQEIFHLEDQSKHQKNNHNHDQDNDHAPQQHPASTQHSAYFSAPSKITYVFLEAARSSVEPFLNVFFVSVGLSLGQASLITSLRIFAATIGQPCWKTICNHKIKRNIVMFWLMCLIAASLTFPLPWIAEKSSQISITDCPNKQTLKTIKEHRVDMTTCTSNNNGNTSTHSVLFFIMLSVNIAGGVFSGSLPMHVDEIAGDVIYSSQANLELSHQQLFGVAGKGIGAFFGGMASENYQFGYKGNFCVYLPTIGLLLVASVLLFHQVRRIPYIQRQHYTCVQIVHALPPGRIENILLLTSIVFIGVADGVHQFFLLVYLQDLQASKLVMGLSIGIAQFTIMITLSFGAFNFNKLQDNLFPLFTLSMVCYSLQMYFTSIATNQWIILPIQLLYGVGYTSFWTCILDYYKTKTQKKFQNSLHNIFRVLHQSVGFITANIIGGVFYRTLGGSVFFRRLSFVYVTLTIASVLCGICKWTLQRNKLQTEYELENSSRDSESE